MAAPGGNFSHESAVAKAGRKVTGKVVISH
jgi:hypothetical protein